jgi:hypothetical protein
MTSATGSVLVLGSVPMISARRMPASRIMAVSVLPYPVPMVVQHYCIVPVNGLFSLLVTIRPVLLPECPLSVWMAGPLVLIAWAIRRRRGGRDGSPRVVTADVAVAAGCGGRVLALSGG